MVIAGIDPDPANNERITKWARDYWNALHPYSDGGAYVNFMMEEGRIESKQPTGKTMRGWLMPRGNGTRRICFE